jgi:OPA family glycerol-3-phosphate transporter-like MFS transporter
VAAVLYGGMLAGSVGMYFLLGNVMLMWLLIFMSLCVIGVHGMLSGTASMDFGGAKNAGIAVGIIDGFVYLGTAVMSFWYGWRLPKGEEAADPANWGEWPLWMIPLSIIGLVLAAKLWNAKPKPKKAAAGGD